MKRTLLSVLSSLLLIGAVSAQIESIGMIGTATPFGWDADTNMVQDVDSAHLWTLTIDLIAGEAKFRANDDWAMNWGTDTFPMATGTQDGLNIPIPFDGTYDVSFNSNTGYYFFDAVSPVGILGDATPFGWDRDINMTQDTADANVFWTEINLVPGGAKFRLNDDWAVNWGADEFPVGVGVQDGPNIPVSEGGNYTISIDTSSGAYSFRKNVAFDSVGIVGDATPGGWDSETQMTVNPNTPTLWSLSIRLEAGDLQFSGNGGEVRWGGSDFPEGVAADGDTLTVPAGLWVITFDSKSLEYSFEEVTIYQTVGIIGDATPGGWDTDTDMNRSPADSSVWMLRIELLDGEAKFRADNDWVDNWGAGDFPSGTADRDGANIPITAGEYNITFNSFTLAYNFQEIIVYDTIGLIGTGTSFGDWDNDVFMTKDPDDENMWTIQETTLSDGEVKFRVNQDWAVNWGADSWPTGTGTQDGPNIPSVAGNYGITLNSASGEYAFGDPLSATEKLLKPSDIVAYPNPATDELNIDLSGVNMQGTITLDIFDINGQLVASHKRAADNLVQIRTNTLPTGHYTLQIRNDKYIVGKRFVIAR